MAFLSRGFKNLQWYSMTESIESFGFRCFFCCKNALSGVGQSVGQPPDPHRDPHAEMRGKVERGADGRFRLLSGTLVFLFCLHDLSHEAAHRLRCLILFLPCCVSVGSQGESRIVVSQHAADGFDVYSVLKRQGCEGVSEIVKANVWQSRVLQYFLV